MNDKYLNTKGLCDIFRCSSRTIFRRMQEQDNPLPPPAISRRGSSNLWSIRAIEEYLNREQERTSQDRFLNEQEAISKRRDEPDTNNFH